MLDMATPPPDDNPIALEFTESDERDKLYAALAKAQGAMTNAEMSRTNPHLKSRYATIADILDAAREPLSASELAHTQFVFASGSRVACVTTLGHSSGQWARTVLRLTAKGSDPQSIGSAITYARRYALGAMLGIAPGLNEDDDGEGNGDDGDGDGGSEAERNDRPFDKPWAEYSYLYRARRGKKPTWAEFVHAVLDDTPTRLNAEQTSRLLDALASAIAALKAEKGEKGESRS